MHKVRETLLATGSFVDNEYFEKYCNLIERNTRTPLRHGLTNSHHIIPRAYFRINNLDIDDSFSNRVNLFYRDHVIAHYFLCLCTTAELQFANELALILLLGKKKFNVVDKQLITSMPEYKNILERCEAHRNEDIVLRGSRYDYKSDC